MSKRKYNPLLKLREQAHKVASEYLICGVTDLDGAVYVLNKDLNNVVLSRSTAEMINKVKHYWSFCACVAGRYKNGKVWVKTEQTDATVQAFAEEVSPLVSEFVDGFFNSQSEDTRLCRWWLARPKLNYEFTAEDVMVPAYLADVFRAFKTKIEDEAGMDYGNHPPEVAGKNFSLDQFREWWDANHSPRSQIKELWLEGSHV